MSDATFRRLYGNLNPKQRDAVDAIQGPVMVIAGPGTGKTSILTLRIANILQKTDTSPDSILALTFTESGAYSMRRKLVEIIGGAAYRVGIFTFHGFANHLIHRYHESFPRIVGGRPATSADQARILEDIFLKNRFKRIRPFGDIFYYVPRALRAIRDLKRENISPAEFKKALVAEARRIRQSPDRFHVSGRFRGELKASLRDLLRTLEKSRELTEAYEQYEDALARERLFDFEDMLLQAIGVLEKDTDLLLTLQEHYQYILADEHQDANNAQNKMLELLSSFDERPNLFIVGDEKQAIYRFQGASLENFLYFKKRFPKALLINLEENYRSTQAILDAAHSLMEKGALPGEDSRHIGSSGLPRALLRPRLRGTRQGDRRNIRFFEFSRPPAEIGFVVSDIEERLKKGIPPREIALLVRDNTDALPFVEAFEKTTIPFSVLSDEDILRHQELGKLLRILRAVSEPGNPKLFSEMLHVDFLGVAPLTLYELLRFCHTKRLSLFEVLTHRRLQRMATIGKGEALTRAFADFTRWATLARNSSAGEAVERIARESGFVRYLLSQRGSLRSLEKLDALFASLKELSAHRRVFRLSDFLETLDRLQKHGLRLSGRGARPEFYESVTLMTAHRAKGLEFDYVYITGAVDGHWGGRRARSDFYLPVMYSTSQDGDEDERRLFFVALTRARKEVLITMAQEGEGGKPHLPSQFVEDIDQKLLCREDTRTLEKRLAGRTPLYLKPRINVGPSLTFTEYLRNVFLEQGLTVTALNNYLSCPWKYFFKNLVRLPQLPEPYLSYGTAVHEALHGFFNTYRKSGKAGKQELLRQFDRALEKSPLPLREFGEYKRRGHVALAGYVDAYKGTWQKDTFNEFEITGVFLPLDVNLSFPRKRESRTDSSKKLDSRLRGNDKKSILLLRGVIDKLERNPDGTVTVVDYKTGKPKSRAEILGETKSSEGNMKRQLDFYKLLLQGLTLNRLDRGLFASPRSPEHFASQNVLRGKRLNLGEMAVGVVDFVEPDAKGKYHREAFAITEKDAAALTEEVQRVGKEIYELAFWNKKCDNRMCEWCRLRQSLA